MPHYYVNDDLSKAQGIEGDLDWLVMNHLHEPINDDEYKVIAVPFPIRRNWQTRDKIH